jgi:hypothetical protein
MNLRMHADSPSMAMLIETVADIDRQIALVRSATAGVLDWIVGARADPLAVLHRMKFDPVGKHPVDGHDLNFIEQVNQTWTYLTALAAARQLLLLHPDVGGFKLAPGAHASQPLDVMSVAEGVVGAETFAAVHPRNNRKLANDLDKMGARPEQHRYVFFLSPAYAGSKRRPELERDGVQVWSVDVECNG